MDEGREQFYKDAIRDAQRSYEADNSNAQALVRWGGALLELAHYRQGEEASNYIEEAIAKLTLALDKEPGRADANWCLGNAYTSQGFLASTRTEAVALFNRASACFRQCKDKDPANETYKKALEMCEKAPEYYDEIQSQLQQAGGLGGGGGGGESSRGGRATAPNDFWWDLAGWVCLVGFVLVGLAFTRGPATAPTKTGPS